MTPFPRTFLMGFLRRLFSRSPNAAAITSRPEANLPAEPSEGGVTVPPDHHVTFYRPSIEPKLQRSHGGTLIAHLGSASDEFREELRRIADEIDIASTNDPVVGRKDLRPSSSRRIRTNYRSFSLQTTSRSPHSLVCCSGSLTLKVPTSGFANPNRSWQLSAEPEPTELTKD